MKRFLSISFLLVSLIVNVSAKARVYTRDGEKFIAHLDSSYSNKKEWNVRREQLKKEVRQNLDIDRYLEQCVSLSPVLGSLRVYDGYCVQNICFETLPGIFVCGSIYAPLTKGKHPAIICPNGHFVDGRYRADQQQRLGTLARMGAICIDYDLYGWGQSEQQVGKEAHKSPMAHIMQTLNGIKMIDYALSRKDVDKKRIGVNGGSGGGSQCVLLSVLDKRITASCPVVMLNAQFDGGCQCESGMPIFSSCGGTCIAELSAVFAPKPMMVVSDGGDWTANVPVQEFPYLQRVYGFYHAKDKVQNVHLDKERHDFGPNKRQACYDFFAKVFKLRHLSVEDEIHITIEPIEKMQSKIK